MLTREGVPLAPLTTLGLGGPAQRLVTAYDEGEVVDAVLASARVPLLVLGGGSNVGRRRRGLRRHGGPGRLARAGHPSGTGTTCCSPPRPARTGTPSSRTPSPRAWPAWRRCPASPAWSVRRRSRTSGRTAPTPPQVVERVRVLDRTSRRVVELTAKQCAFGYRASRFKADVDRWVVQAVTYRLTPWRSARRCATASWPGRSASSRAGGRRSARSARRCSRCAAARAWSSTPATPTAAAPARSSPTRSSTTPSSPRWAPGSATSRCPATRTGRAGPSCRRPGYRAGRLPQGLAATGRWACRASTCWRWCTAAAAPPRSCWTSRARSATACASGWEWTSSPSRSSSAPCW